MLMLLLLMMLLLMMLLPGWVKGLSRKLHMPVIMLYSSISFHAHVYTFTFIAKVTIQLNNVCSVSHLKNVTSLHLQ